ncbi:MAG: phosphoribosylanthranilate isomerase, partial [Cyanobacteria bacterium J06632_3]
MVKICGITSVEQGRAIAQYAPYALGYICVRQSPRYVSPEKIAAITSAVVVEKPEVQHFGVFVNESVGEMVAIAHQANLTTLQLHGDETSATCQLLRDALKNADLSNVQIVKAFRIRSSADLTEVHQYEPYVDML